MLLWFDDAGGDYMIYSHAAADNTSWFQASALLNPAQRSRTPYSELTTRNAPLIPRLRKNKRLSMSRRQNITPRNQHAISLY